MSASIDIEEERKALAETVYIYALTCPITEKVRYIGKANNVEDRYKSHYRDCRRKDTPVYRWMRKNLKNGYKVGVKTIMKTDSLKWMDDEKKVILEFANHNLLNVALGGDEPFCSLETRKSNGRKVSQLIQGDEGRKKMWKLKQSIGYALKDLKEKNPEKHNFYLSELHKRGLFLQNSII